VDRFEWNKDQNVEKRVKCNAGTENSVWGAIIGEKSVTCILTVDALSWNKMSKSPTVAMLCHKMLQLVQQIGLDWIKTV